MAGRRGGPTTIGGARKARRHRGCSRGEARGGGRGWKERNRVVGSTAQAQQKKLLASAGWISSRESTIIVWIRRLSRPPALPPSRPEDGGGERGRAWKRSERQRSIPFVESRRAWRIYIPSVALRDHLYSGTTPLIRRAALTPSHTFSLSLSQRAARLLPIHPLGMPPFHPVTSGTARPRLAAPALLVCGSTRLCDRVYTGSGAACVKTSTLRNGSPLSPMRFLTLCLEREGGARTNDGGECDGRRMHAVFRVARFAQGIFMGNRSSFLRVAFPGRVLEKSEEPMNFWKTVSDLEDQTVCARVDRIDYFSLINSLRN